MAGMNLSTQRQSMTLHEPIETEDRLAQLLDALQIDDAVLAARGLPRQDLARTLTLAEVSDAGTSFYLTPDAARAWWAMKAAARLAGLRIELVSAYRSHAEQAELIARKLRAGMALQRIFALSAPPGYSEHHTGRALDINTDGCAPAEQEFAATPAFGWLQAHARRFGFVLSYPENNASGFVFEPWHWYYVENLA